MYPTIREYAFFLGMRGTFADTDPSLSHKARFNKYSMTNILRDTFYEFNAIECKGNNLLLLLINFFKKIFWLRGLQDLSSLTRD